jgi:hypothetical protein
VIMIAQLWVWCALDPVPQLLRSPKGLSLWYSLPTVRLLFEFQTFLSARAVN